MNRKTMMTTILGAALAAFSVFAQEPTQAAPQGGDYQQVYSGILVDADCKAADAAGKCEVGAATKMYGLQSADGRYMKVDVAGNGKVKDALDKAKTKTGSIKAVVTGKADGDTLKVASVQLD